MIKLNADEGKTYTNGETYGKEICLPDNADVSRWYQIDDSLVPEDGSAIKYSVRSIIREMRLIGKYDQFRTFLETQKMDWDFIGSNYLLSSDSDFITMCSAIVAQGIITRQELNELLPKCIWTPE